MPLFSNKQETNLRSCISMIEDVITELGHQPEGSRLETESEWPAWSVEKGAARVFIFLQGRGEDNQIQVTSPVMHLDGVGDTPALMRRLLELNAAEIHGAAFALQGQEVILTAERSTVDLDRSEVLDLVRRVEDYATRFDESLVREFGGRPAARPAQ